MNRLLSACVAIAAAAALQGCTTSSGPVELSAFRPMDPMGCKTNTNNDVFIGDGILDVASGRPSFVVTVELTNSDLLRSTPIVRSDGKVLDDEFRDNAAIEEVVYSYRTTPSIGTIRTETIPFAAVFPNATTQLDVALDLISPAAAEVLRTLAPTADPREVQTTLMASLNFRGRLMRSKQPFSTGTVAFPIQIVRSNPNCDPALGFATNACGVSGQNASASCCMAGATNCVLPK